MPKSTFGHNDWYINWTPWYIICGIVIPVVFILVAVYSNWAERRERKHRRVIDVEMVALYSRHWFPYQQATYAAARAAARAAAQANAHTNAHAAAAGRPALPAPVASPERATTQGTRKVLPARRGPGIVAAAMTAVTAMAKTKTDDWRGGPGPEEKARTTDPFGFVETSTVAEDWPAPLNPAKLVKDKSGATWL